MKTVSKRRSLALVTEVHVVAVGVGFWFAMALFGVAAAPGQAWWLFAGAAAMLAMFLGASIPMMETRSLQRRPEYQDVIDRVSRFVPRPPRKAKR